MTKFNFGLCLADDMGLGKTIQVIALLCYLKKNYPEKPGSILIVCPTSILFNWHREIKKFAPNLEVMLHYGSSRIKDASSIPEILEPHKIILTSYGTLRNDIDLLESIDFSGIIIDESQNIKNYDQSIISGESLKRNVKGIGTKIASYIDEILEKGYIQDLQDNDLKENGYKEFLSIVGVGQAKAMDWISKNIYTISHLKEEIKKH